MSKPLDMATAPCYAYAMIESGTEIKFDSKRGGFYGVTTEGRDIPASELQTGMEMFCAGIAQWCDVTVHGVRYGKVRLGLSGDRTGMALRPGTIVRVR